MSEIINRIEIQKFKNRNRLGNQLQSFEYQNGKYDYTSISKLNHMCNGKSSK